MTAPLAITDEAGGVWCDWFGWCALLRPDPISIAGAAFTALQEKAMRDVGGRMVLEPKFAVGAALYLAGERVIDAALVRTVADAMTAAGANVDHVAALAFTHPTPQ